MKHDEDKIVPLDSHKLLAASGPVGDRHHFTDYIQKSLNLYTLRNDVPLSTHGAAAFTRNQLASSLRSRSPYQVNLLLGGHDEKQGPSLYFTDYLGSMHPMKVAAHGYGSYFTFSILDRGFKKDMTEEEGKELISQCIKEIQKRLVLNTSKFMVKAVDKNGVREITL